MKGVNKLRNSVDCLTGLIPYDPKYLPADTFLSANENTDDIPAQVRALIMERLEKLPFNRYPDPLANNLRDAIAQANGLHRENVLIGNGGDELLFDIALAWGGPNRKLLNLPPTFSVYAHNAVLCHTEIVNIARKDDLCIDEPAVLDRLSQCDIDYVVITSPNNPTGDVASRAFIEQVLEASDALVLADEAYCEFSGASVVDMIAQHKNLVVLRTFSKAYSLAGLRLGYVFAQAEVINELCKVRQPYSVDAISQTIGLSVFESRQLFQARIETTIEERKKLYEALCKIPGLKVYPSEANYILFRVDQAESIWRALFEKGILIRDFSRSPGLTDCLRVTVGSAQENEAFLKALIASLEEKELV